jgi:hypothetical protein
VKKKRARGPGKRVGVLHLDKRAERLLADPVSDGNDEELLTTKQVAEWFQCSPKWLEWARTPKGPRGPKFITLANRMIRYPRGECRKFLAKRMHGSTAEYTR